MFYSLSSSRAMLAKEQQDLDRKDSQARGFKPPSPQEQNKWTEQETQMNSLLLSEQAVPQLFEEVTRIATETGIQRLGINTEEVTIDTAKVNSPEESKVVSAGIHHYLAVTLKFQGRYEDVARFLGGVAKLDRPIEYHLADLKRAVPLIEVQLVMNVYKREA
jgi:Tfp pilus assembly protein PilO